LAALARLPVEKARLCNAALCALRSYHGRDAAAEIIEEHFAHADEALICDALAQLINLATPPPSRFGFSERRLTRPGPLREAYGLHTAAVINALKALLEEHDASKVGTAARGLAVLAEQDQAVPTLLMSALASKLARAKWLVQGSDEAVDDA